jgi:hypothetical protein
MSKLIIYGFSCFLILTTSISCNNNNANTVIPNIYVDVLINIQEPSSFALQPLGGYLYHPGGSGGLIVYHAEPDKFVCFDRHSTFNPSGFCSVNVDSSGFKLVDTCSTSEFSIFDGSVIKGPATIPLKQYITTFDGTYIQISNQ